MKICSQCFQLNQICNFSTIFCFIYNFRPFSLPSPCWPTCRPYLWMRPLLVMSMDLTALARKIPMNSSNWRNSRNSCSVRWRQHCFLPLPEEIPSTKYYLIKSFFFVIDLFFLFNHLLKGLFHSSWSNIRSANYLKSTLHNYVN